MMRLQVEALMMPEGPGAGAKAAGVKNGGVPGRLQQLATG